MEQSPKKVLIQSLCLRPVAACNDKRIHEPHALLAQIPGVTIASAVKSSHIERSSDWDAKVFIWQRPIMTRQNSSIQNIRMLLSAGYLIVLEYDDYPERWAAHGENDYLSFKGVHAIQTTTPALADYFLRFNPNVKIFPNQIIDTPPLALSDSGPVQIFFGALNREADWRRIIQPLNEVIAQFGDQLSFKVIHDKHFFDALNTSHKTFTPTCEYDEYLSVLHHCDIALLPLQDREFNRYKSDLKFLECASSGAVALASPLIYRDTIEEEVTGLLFRDPAEFVEKLTRLITDRAYRRQLAGNAHQWLKAHRMLTQHVMGRYHWYLELNEKLPALTHELKQRYPEIG
jgi:glycosyltransferase involved in cell wall biosynthesis